MNNIAELLLGLGGPQIPNAGANEPGATGGPGNDFAALLGMLSGIGVTPQAVNSMVPASPHQSAQTGTLLGLAMSSSTVAAQPTMTAEVLPNLMGISSAQMAAIVQNASTQDTPVDPGPRTSIDAQPVNQNAAAMIAIPAQLQVANLVSQLPDGKYTVLSASVNDNRLDLQVMSQDNPGSPIRLSIPIALLQKPTQAGTAARQALMGINGPTSPSGVTADQLNDLLAKVQVSDIEISRTAPTPATNSLPAVNIALRSAESPIAPVLTATLPTQQFKPFMTSTSAAPKSGEPVSSTDDMAATTSEAKPPVSTAMNGNSFDIKPVSQMTGAVPAEQEPMFRSAAIRVNNKIITAESATVKKLLGDGEQADSSLFKLGLTDGTMKGQSIIRPLNLQRLEQPAVRMTLPQDLSRLVDGQGRSISIKLEPDFLGPARLNLSVRGESLTAKLTVETPQAKAAVENSLPQLTDQLAKAGIRVDYFDVSMRGGDAGNQQFHRPQEWFTQNRPRFANREDEPVMESSSAAETAALPRAFTYINQRGVNLYA